MNEIWQLPLTTDIGGKTYHIHGDFRDILEIFSYWENPDLTDFLRWRIALALFYEEQIPQKSEREAMEYLAFFIRCGQREEVNPSPRLIDWQQDAPAIISDVNKVAGREIRSMPFLHWWTFMAWFFGIGEGQLSTILSIREKLRRGEKLEKWEAAFYRENKQRIDIKKRYSQSELEEQAKIRKLLGESDPNGERGE